MRCHPVRWLWGIFPLSVLIIMALQDGKGRMELDLHLRAQEALARAGLLWAYTEFDGRDATLTGEGPNGKEAARALEVVRRVWGVRTVVDRTGPAEFASTYFWGVQTDGSTVELLGYVPNAITRKSIMGLTRATFPRREIVDRMTVASGAPAQTLWLGSISFTLDQLRRMRRGAAYLKGPTLVIGGESASPSSFRQIATSLAGGAPRGLKVEKAKVTPPLVKPFSWEAKLTPSGLILSGTVPTRKAKDALFDLAKNSFPVIALVDRTEAATGAVRGWDRAAYASLAALAKLETGTATVKTEKLVLQGIAADPETAESVRANLNKNIPPSFARKIDITVQKVQREQVSPFVTVVSAARGRTEISGYVPGREEHAGLYRWLSVHLPGRTITDSARAADGAPGTWAGCLEAGIIVLGKLGTGQIRLTDTTLEIRASTRDRQLAASLPAEARALAPPQCNLDLQIAYAGSQDAALAPPSAASPSHGPPPQSPPRPEQQSPEQQKEQLNQLRQGQGSRAEQNSHKQEDHAQPGSLARPGTESAGEESTDRGAPAAGPSEPEVSSAAAAPTPSSQGFAGQEASGKEAPEKHDPVPRISGASPSGAPGASGSGAQSEMSSTETAPSQHPPQENEARLTADGAAAGGPGTGPGSGTGEAASAKTAEKQVKTLVESWSQTTSQGTESQPVTESCREALEKLPRGIIRFERASSALTRESTPLLDRFAAIAKLCPQARIEIEGHTDSDGTHDANAALSRHRAETTLAWLVNAGIDRQRLHATGHGELVPIAPNDNSENRARNRRVEISVKLR